MIKCGITDFMYLCIMFKFGFFFHLPANGRLYQELVLGFDGKMFRFYFVDNDIIPSKYHNSTDRYYELDWSVLYSSQGNKVTNIIFFNDLNIEDLSFKNISSLQFKVIVGESAESNDLIYGSKSIFENNYLTEREIEFGKLVLEKFISNQYLDKLRAEATYISASDIYREHKWKGVVNRYKEYIDSVDLEKILNSLWVKVWDYHKTKIGDDDTYYVYREAKLLDGTIITDPYLKNIIGLGEDCVERESGYTSYFPRPNIPFGVYENEILAAEKRRIIDRYSKEEHMGWLFYNQLFKQENIKKDITKWEQRRKSAIDNIETHFYYVELNSLDNRLFYEFSSHIINHDDILKRINRLIYYIQENTPSIYVVISGTLPFGEENKWSNKIQETIKSLSADKRLILISGNANGAEQVSMRYALENQIEVISDYSNWTLCGRDRCSERAKDMIAKSQLLIITECKSDLSKNLLFEAKAKGIPVKIIK